MKTCNKIISLLLSVLMIFGGTGVPLSALAEESTGESTQSENTGGYDDMLKYFREHMKKREEDISYNFVTTDKKYDELHNTTLTDNDFGNELNRQIFFDIFKNGGKDPYLNDYLYNSLYHQITNNDSNPSVNEGTYTFKIEFKFEYYTTAEQEKYISDFLKNFNNEYISDNMSDYMKVKTIYDFIVRNTEYDDEVKAMNPNDTKNPLTSEQMRKYKIAHSAYGAICGNNLNSGKKDTEYAIAPKDKATLSGEKIINAYRQGLAVCEGYSKLFYALCISNGIPCRIVRGDYVDKNKNDPHEWNYVWLDDGVKSDGARWYIVDSTSASERSAPQVDINNYDLFLRGSDNENFGETKHQMPYTSDNHDELYDWNSKENASSKEDYEFPENNISIKDETDFGFTVKRTAKDTQYQKVDQIEFIKYSPIDSSGSEFRGVNIAFDTKDTVVKDAKGFDYTGVESSFDIYIPYMLSNEYSYSVVDSSGKTVSDARNAGTYYFIIESKNKTQVKLPFEIVPRNMSNFEGNYDKEKSNVEKEYPYTGNTIEVATTIIDGFNNKLELGKDYSLQYKKGEEIIEPKDIKNRGDYTCIISFFGNNYCGVYPLAFTVGKIDLSKIRSDNGIEFTYYPEPARIKQGIYTPADMYRAGAAGLNIGDYAINIDKDFSVDYEGSWSVDGGEIVLTGLPGSDKVKAGTQMKIKYTVKPYDISSYNGSKYDNGIYIYNGSKIYPNGASGATLIQKDVDYKIVSYSDNVNVGEAKLVIEGIGGCTGRAVMTYLIQPKSINQISLSGLSCTADGRFSYALKDGNKTLKKGVDYSENVSRTSTGYKLVISGIGNYNGTKTVNVNVIVPKNNNNNGGSSSPGSKSPQAPSVKVNKPTLKSVNSKKKKTLAISWKKPGGKVSGYYVEYSTSKNFKKGKKSVRVKGANKTSLTVKKLKSKKKYYVRVRTYYTKGRYTYLSGWSNVKSVKVK